MAKRYACPHCGEKTISLWRRLFLGPALPTRCSACQQRVGVSWSMTWIGLVVGLMAVALHWAMSTIWPTASFGWRLCGLVLGLLILTLPFAGLLFRLFPLQKR